MRQKNEIFFMYSCESGLVSFKWRWAFLNPIKAGGSESMYSLGERLAPPPQKNIVFRSVALVRKKLWAILDFFPTDRTFFRPMPYPVNKKNNIQKIL